MTIEVKSVEDLPSAAKFFLEETDNRKVFAFEGQMGAGKTTFIVSLLKAMGVEDIEGSPTYSIVNVYESAMFGKINHFDMYRIKNDAEAFDAGIEEMLYSGGVCLIEWPEKVINLLPNNTIWVYIRKLDNDSRTITIEQ